MPQSFKNGLVKARWLASLLLSVCVLISPPSGASPAEDVYKKVSPSVVTIGIFSTQGELQGTGSGVVVAKGKVITNDHVAGGASGILVRHKNKNYPARILRSLANEGWDMVLLDVPTLPAPAVDVLGAGVLRIGQAVYALGSPLGLELTLTTGIVSSLRPIRGHNVIQTSAPISPGSSGGGLFDEAGSLIGITTSKEIAEHSEGLAYALPAELASELLEPGSSRVKSNPIYISGVLFAVLFSGFMLFRLLRYYSTRSNKSKDSSDYNSAVLIHSNKQSLQTGKNASTPNNISTSPKNATDASDKTELIAEPDMSDQSPLPRQLPADSPLYEMALKELDGNLLHDVWDKAIAWSGGDKPRARSRYIQLRASMMDKGRDSDDATKSSTGDLLVTGASPQPKRPKQDNQQVQMGGCEKLCRGLFDRAIEALQQTSSATHFLIACQRESYSYVQGYLKENPLFVGVRNGDGNTGLHIAIIEKRHDIASLLISCGAPVLWKNNFETTALTLANKNFPTNECADIRAAAKKQVSWVSQRDD